MRRRKGDGLAGGPIRLEGLGGGMSLSERFSGGLHKLTWRTPLHALRLRGRFPLKLTAVPEDPIRGDDRIGRSILNGQVPLDGLVAPLSALFDDTQLSKPMTAHLQSFAWLRDLAAVGHYSEVAPAAEAAMRGWLDKHGKHVSDTAWRPDVWGRRILAWTAHAPLILSSEDETYRSAVLNTLARGARHIDRCADKAPQGVPRIAAWAGVVTAGLLIPGGEKRLQQGEAGLARAMAVSMYDDGGLANRSPASQLELVEVLAQLGAVYEAVARPLPEPLANALATAVPALLSVTLGDDGLSSWQGGTPMTPGRVVAAVAASRIRTRPLRHARDWGYQHVHQGQTRLVIDAAPPPIARLTAGSCASTLAFEMTDGPHRLIVNCGGARLATGLPAEFAAALRTTAAHSTLILADSNSTAIHADGALGRGVSEVEMDRRDVDGAIRIDSTHDGYVRRFGFKHRRQLQLSADGRELHGDDLLLPAGKRRAAVVDFAVRFHLGPGVEASTTADGQGALLRLMSGQLWQFRCRGGTLAIEESLWIDGLGRPVGTRQLVVSGETALSGTGVTWLLRRAS
ncbi:heparinase II/III family protein [Sphingomonas naphthae]|uniref:Heparinase II/III family protein n=1 Tax=Sphingomonas naphthae TaxID=1813468 RepID=A0ABY7TIY6_9SPHN|nr:heparinase II/III family protein [Sphingomonas naphthae]WCT73188.1 heparinase II/III family protein [Sphingomonas naphthae]